MKKIFWIIFVFALQSNLVLSQINFTRDTSVKIIENNLVLENAWNGGLNSSQFSEIDLNLDGIKDIIVFDRCGNKLSPYINNNGNFVYSPQYRNFFPKIENWILMDDYDCDGRNDIFTYSTAGIAVYRNNSSSVLSFILSDSLLTNTTSGQHIYVSPIDIPAITDVDSDGDLDILTFEIAGGFVHYFKNMSIENYNNCDYLEYSFSDGCWGDFYEGLNTYTLNCSNCQCTPIINGNLTKETKHAGSSLMAIDVDGDNDKDLILGDVSFNNLNLLINGGDNQNALITSVDTAFPKNNINTIPADIHIFPAAYFIDVTNDGVKDLIVTSNMQNNSENFESCWLYENSGSNILPDFNFVQKDFIQGTGLDFGENAHPTFYDHNEDGLLDLFVGNYGYHLANGTPISKIAYYQNTGTIQDPEFSLITDDFEGISNINLNTNLNTPALNLFPTFGDLNGDGDKDLVIGDSDGKVHLFLNNGGNFSINAPNLGNIDVGYFATPQIVDVNRDGLKDLIIGNKKGTISYFENTGTQTVPNFSLEFQKWGGIDIDSTFIQNGYSSPKLIDINGEYYLFTGSYSGKIYLYNNIDGNLNGIFTELNYLNNNVWEGEKISIAVSDINNDNQVDLIIGNQCGGLAYFRGDSSIINSVSEIHRDIEVFPNPSSERIYIDNKKKETVFIYDSTGRLVIISKNNNIDISNLQVGTYFIKISERKSQFIKQ